MANEIELNEFIKQLKSELCSDEGTELSRAEVEISFTARADESGKLRFMVASTDSPSDAKQVHRLKIELTARMQSENNALIDSAFKSSELSLADTEESEFEGFKRRFQESVERHGGVPPNKKKSLFD